VSVSRGTSRGATDRHEAPLSAALALLALPALSAELSGIVTEVQDGDTLTLVNSQATDKIRLADIDAQIKLTV